MSATSVTSRGYTVMRPLETLRVAESRASVAAVAEALTIHPRTARRIIERLVADGYLEKAPGCRSGFRPRDGPG
jgi:DNA-binding IclR family transcriptional regulator